MIIECAGLPGAGKTTVCSLVTLQHADKHSTPIRQFRPSLGWARATLAVMLLSLSARPFRAKRLKRALYLSAFLRHYRSESGKVLLDQGIVQKLWSLLVDARTYSGTLLDDAISALSPFAPDYLVWIEVPVEVAAARIASRQGGRSRYDALPPDVAIVQLGRRLELLKELAVDFSRRSSIDYVCLDGFKSASANAQRIDELLMAESNHA